MVVVVWVWAGGWMGGWGWGGGGWGYVDDESQCAAFPHQASRDATRVAQDGFELAVQGCAPQHSILVRFDLEPRPCTRKSTTCRRARE